MQLNSDCYKLYVTSFYVIMISMRIKVTKFFLLTFSLVLLGSFLFTTPAFASIELVKSSDFGTVYYIDNSGVRHTFPNETTYTSWYGNNFSKIVTVSNSFLFNYPLGKNITIKPGTHLVKIRTAPQTYAVEQGGVLREILSEDVAERIYGKDWSERVVDVPDVFFDNYILGSPIETERDLPSSILYQNKDTNKYFYFSNSLLTPFLSEEAVLANGFKLTDAILANYDFQKRERPITGLNKNIFDPVALPILDNRDCENKKLKAAVIFLTEGNYSNDEITKVQNIKKEISARYNWVTHGLSEIDVSYPTVISLNDGYLLQKRNDNTTNIKNELINTFYDSHPDIFDFIIIWTNFITPQEDASEIAHFSPTSNIWEGIGKYNFDSSFIYGGTGKLKGTIVMGNINKYNPEDEKGLNESLNVVMHEILHNWAAYVDFIDEDGNRSEALLRDKDFKHWSYYGGFISPLGGSGWIDNGNGTFTNGLTKIADTNLRQYSQLDLYLMGLLPAISVDPIMYVEPTTKGEVGNIISGKALYVDIEQIISANGKVRCNFN